MAFLYCWYLDCEVWMSCGILLLSVNSPSSNIACISFTWHFNRTVICTITFIHFVTVQIIIPFRWSWKWKCLISDTIMSHCCWHIWEPQVLHFIASMLWVPHNVYYDSNWNFVSYKICDKEDMKYDKYFAQVVCFTNLHSSNPSQKRYGCTNNILALNSLILVFWSWFVEGISFRIAQVVLICFAQLMSCMVLAV